LRDGINRLAGQSSTQTLTQRDLDWEAGGINFNV
jgi:hypothetical protein